MNQQRETLQDFAAQMKSDWDDRARWNAKWFINTFKLEQSDEEFYATATIEVESAIHHDPVITAGRDLKSLRLLEIGCGIGRMTRLFAEMFGEVHAVDVSGEMIQQARERLANYSNVYLYETNGLDFAELPNDYFDLIFSVYVFQHVPSREIIRANIKDAGRVLKPGGLFKFQTNGIEDQDFETMPKDTWTGVSFPESDIRRAARDFGMQIVRIDGAGRKYCGITLRKPLLTFNVNQAMQVQIVEFSRTTAPQLKAIPITGPEASLTLIISGQAPEEADANRLNAELAGREIWPCYAGIMAENFAAMLKASGMKEQSHLTQINLSIPYDIAPGLASVRVRDGQGSFSESILIELLEPQPVPPRIYLISNSVDGGLDVYAHGPKSHFRVFVYDLDRKVTAEQVFLQLDEKLITPTSINYFPYEGMHMLAAQLPADILPGMHTIRIISGSLESPPKSLELLCYSADEPLSS